MVVFSNQRLGASAELLVSTTVAIAMLQATAAAARLAATARWEVELARWLDCRATLADQLLDVSEIAWTPDHFELQRAFVIDAIDRAAVASGHERALAAWHKMVAAHPQDAVQVGRRWDWPAADGLAAAPLDAL